MTFLTHQSQSSKLGNVCVCQDLGLARPLGALGATALYIATKVPATYPVSLEALMLAMWHLIIVEKHLH